MIILSYCNKHIYNHFYSLVSQNRFHKHIYALSLTRACLNKGCVMVWYDITRAILIPYSEKQQQITAQPRSQGGRQRTWERGSQQQRAKTTRLKYYSILKNQLYYSKYI